MKYSKIRKWRDNKVNVAAISARKLYIRPDDLYPTKTIQFQHNQGALWSYQYFLTIKCFP